jgi:S1-C subfamily serine protease
VVVSLAGSEVADLEEYAAMLSRTRPGSEIEIVVLRDDRRVTTRATLGQRR